MTLLGSKIQKLGLGVFMVACLAAVIAFIWQSARAHPETETANSEGAQSASQGSNSDSAVLPAFDTTTGITVTSLTRLADLDTRIPQRPRTDVITYTVQAGDNLFAIADKYGLEPETLLWGNYETLHDNPQLLTIGQVLNVLPENGAYYQVPEGGQSLQSIAEYFKVDPEAIANYRGNDIREDLTAPLPNEVAAGTWLIIPGGKRELKDWGPPAITRTNPASAAYYGSGYCGTIYEGAVGYGSFVWPTTSKTLSGYDYRPPLHWGIDIGGHLGNAIYAVDGGVVVYAGWSEYGYGNLVVIDHGTGWQSAYAHLSAINVGCGDSVYQGQVIAALGSTGNSTGPHLHFELRSEIYGKVNPWEYLTY